MLNQSNIPLIGPAKGTHGRVKTQDFLIKAITKFLGSFDHAVAKRVMADQGMAANEETALGVPSVCFEGQAINQLRHGDEGQVGSREHITDCLDQDVMVVWAEEVD